MPEMKVHATRHNEALKDEITENFKGTMCVLDKTGDVRVTWNARDKDEVAAAEKQFKELVGKRFNAYAVKEDGKPGERITKFDPDAQKIILAPPLAGGSGPTDKEIEEVIDWASEDQSRYPGMTYEQGVDAALRWVTGQSDERPDSE